MGQLEHPNIIPVHALIHDDEHGPSMVMKRVEGTNWRELIKAPNHPNWKSGENFSADPLIRNIEVLIEISKAVGFAHQRGIIHRDIKPDNVMIGALGEVYLLDWGIALKLEDQLHTPFQLEGTPAYMAPEQVSGTSVFSFATDIYLLGACLHEFVSGAPPHLESNLWTTFESAFHSYPPAYGTDIPLELVKICHTAMHHDPEHRYKDVFAFRAALRSFIEHQSSTRLAKTALGLLDDTVRKLEGERCESIHTISFREAEFAFEQARIDWPDNPLAIAGLKRLLVARSKLKLRRNEIAGVEDELKTLRGLQSPDDKETATEADEIQEKRSVLKALQQNADPRISSRARLVFMIGVMLFVTGASLLQVESIMSAHIDYGGAWLFKLALIHNLLQLAVIFLLRKRLWTTTYNRRIATLEIVTAGLILAHRGAALGLDLPIPAVFAGDMLLLAATTFFAGIFIKPPLFFWGLPWVAGALVLSFFPDHGGEIFIFAAACNVLAAVCTRWLYETRDDDGP
jgi:serine/threonine protein kinase